MPSPAHIRSTPAVLVGAVVEGRPNVVCRVSRSIQVKDFELFFGDMTAVFADEACLTAGRSDPVKSDPVILKGVEYLGRVTGALFLEGQGLARAPRQA